MSGNEQQQRMHAAQMRAGNATTAEAKSRADAEIVSIMSEKPKRRA